MDGCIFCKIVAKEIPASVVAETERLLAFRDINPGAPTHILVIPKTHIVNLDTAEDGSLLGETLLLAARVAREEGIAANGYRVVFNVNRDGGQTVEHLHAHLLGGRGMGWPPG